MSLARSRTILSRFPTHLEAARPGKVLGAVVDAVARDLDLLAARMASVRRAHRLGEADEIPDLLRIAALHGITAGEMEILFLRFRNADETMPHRALVSALRSRIARICALHARGNGTVQTILEGAANALDLDIGAVLSSKDRFWHAAPALDRLHPAAAPEIVGIEENPVEPVTIDDTARKHAEVWIVPRRGFGRVPMEVRVTGAENGRTLGPMIVNCDEGRGWGFTGSVPAGKVLKFTEEGRVLLEEADVTPRAYAWEGACFAPAASDGSLDMFVFDGPGRRPDQRAAKFVTTTPAGALDRNAVYPHGRTRLPPPGIDVGATRFAFFVRQAHINGGTRTSPRRVTPLTRAAIFDESVFAPGEASPAAGVAFFWREHRPFRVRLLIPRRFRDLIAGDAEGTEVRRRVSRAIERFRPAGIEITVEFIDERWVVDRGVAGAGESNDLIDKLRAALVLWEAPKEPDGN